MRIMQKNTLMIIHEWWKSLNKNGKKKNLIAHQCLRTTFSEAFAIGNTKSTMKKKSRRLFTGGEAAVTKTRCENEKQTEIVNWASTSRKVWPATW